MSNTPRTQKSTNHLPDSTQNNTRTPKRPITGSVALPAEAREKSVQLWHTACEVFNRTKNVAMPLILRWRGAHIARAEPSERLVGAACSSASQRAVLSWSDFPKTRPNNTRTVANTTSSSVHHHRSATPLSLQHTLPQCRATCNGGSKMPLQKKGRTSSQPRG